MLLSSGVPTSRLPDFECVSVRGGDVGESCLSGGLFSELPVREDLPIVWESNSGLCCRDLGLGICGGLGLTTTGASAELKSVCIEEGFTV